MKISLLTQSKLTRKFLFLALTRVIALQGQVSHFPNRQSPAILGDLSSCLDVTCCAHAVAFKSLKYDTTLIIGSRAT